MKNEKMKRVAALALAGTIAVSTVSPAAFAAGENEEGENENKVVPFAAGEEIAAVPTTVAERNQQTITNNNTTVSNNKKADKKNEDILGSNSSTGNGSESSGSTGSGDQSGGDQGSGDQGGGDQGGGDQGGGDQSGGSTDSGDQSGGSESGGSTSSNQELIDGNPTLTTTDENGQLQPIAPPSLDKLPTLPTLPEDLPKNPSNNQEINDYNNAVGLPTTTGEGENQQTTYPEGSYNHGVQDYNTAVGGYNEDVEDYNNAANQHNKDLDDKLFTFNEESSLDQDSEGLLEDNATIAGDPNTAGDNEPSNATRNEADLEGNAEKVENLTPSITTEDTDNLTALETARQALENLKKQMEGETNITLNNEIVYKEDGKPAKWADLTPDQKNQMLELYQTQVDAYNAAVEKYNHKTSDTASDGTLDKYDAAIDADNTSKITSNSTTTNNNTAAKTNNTNEFNGLTSYLPIELSEDEKAALAALESLGDTVQVPTITAALDEANKTLGADQKIPEGTTSIDSLTPEQHKAVIDAYNALVITYNAAVDTYNKKASSNDQLTIIQKTYQDALAKYNAAVKSEQEAQMNGSLKPAGENTQTNTEVNTTNQNTATANNGKFNEVKEQGTDTLPTVLPTMPTLDAALAAAKDAAIAAAEADGKTLTEQEKAAIEAKYADLTAENQDAVVTAFNTLVDEYNAKVSEYNDGKDTNSDGVNEILSAQEAYDAAWEAYHEKEIQKTYGTNSTTTTDAAGTGTSTGSGNKLTLEQNAAALEDAKKALETIRTLATEEKITLTEAEQKVLTDALAEIEKMQNAGTTMDAVAMPTLDFTGCTTSDQYNDALNDALVGYTQAVATYKAACDAYNAVDGVMDAAQDLLDAKSEAIEAANTESITASLGSLDASYDSVYGIQAAISSNNNNKDNVLSNALEDGKELTYTKTVTTVTDGVSQTVTQSVTLSNKEAAEGELAALTSAVQTEQKTIKEKLDALQELAKNPTAENYVAQYNALVQEYNAALGRCETAIANYNAFVAVCNPKPTLPPSEEQVNPKEVKLGKLTYSKNESTSPAKYYIQIKGEVPFEDQNTSYDNDYYTNVGEGYTVKDATLYPNERSEYDGKWNMDGKNVREGHTRVDVPNATGVITNNQYNNQVINLDNVILKGAGENGANLNLGAEGMKGNLKKQLQAYYANVYEVLGNKPDEQVVLQKILDSETYKAYEASGYTSMGVLWYVVKDSSTGTKGDDVHVDGVVYFTNSGVVYDQNRFSSMSQNLSPLEKLIDTNIRNVQALNTVTTKQHETLSELNPLKKMPANYTKMKVDNLQAVTKVAELKNHTEDLELLQELELTKTENDETKPGDDLYANTLEFLNTLETLKPLELLPTSGGGDEDTELPPEDDFEGEDLLLMQLETTIEDEETALAAGPAAEEETDIEDEDVALSGAPETGDKLVDLADAQVAKSSVPKTGDESGIFLLMSMISGMALAALSFIDRKGRHARFGSQH